MDKENKTEALFFVTKEKISEDLIKKDIEKSYNIENTENTEAYFSDRYGWTLRKISK